MHKVLLLNKKGVRFYFKLNRSAESGHLEMQSAFPEIFLLKSLLAKLLTTYNLQKNPTDILKLP